MDKLLMVYAGADWESLNSALAKFRELLVPGFQQEPINAKSYIPVTKIDQIRAGWKEGKSAVAIAKETGVSRATVYRWQPTIEAEASPAPNEPTEPK